MSRHKGFNFEHIQRASSQWLNEAVFKFSGLNVSGATLLEDALIFLFIWVKSLSTREIPFVALRCVLVTPKMHFTLD